MQEVKDAGAQFVIVKVTEGNGYINPHAAAQVEAALAAGLFVMLYHFARPNGPDWLADARHEAKRLDDIADAFEAKYGKKFFCWLDVERNEPLTDAEKPRWREWCREFRRCCHEELERIIGWYSYSPFTAVLQLEQDWENTLLWLARYPIPFRPAGDYEKWPDAPLPWPRPDVVQDGGDANKATWPGIDGACDVNMFAGTLEELEELISAAA